MENHEKRPLPEARTYTVEDIAAMLNIGRTSAYTLVKEGHFKTVRIGTAIRISKKSFDEWLEEPDLYDQSANIQRAAVGLKLRRSFSICYLPNKLLWLPVNDIAGILLYHLVSLTTTPFLPYII